jgi:hypothetical protein
MTSPKLCLLAWLLSLLALVPFDTVRATQSRDALIIVVGTNFPIEDISFASVKSAFRGQRIQIGDRTLIPINHPLGTPTRIGFDRLTLGLEPAAVGRFWIDMRIRDQGRPPTTATSPELALRIAGALKGAITYALPGTALDKLPIKALTVDNKAAGQPGYPFAR